MNRGYDVVRDDVSVADAMATRAAAILENRRRLGGRNINTPTR